jgi:prepilin-type processing-associated H-X9-DG protein
MYYRSKVSHRKITDGSSNTYLIGEKALSPDFYHDAPTTNQPGEVGRFGDNQGAYSGYEWDNHRVAWNPNATEPATTYQPRQDRPGGDSPSVYAFGSAHASSMNMAMCDGSVQTVSYDIDRDVHRYLASRLDGISAKLEP